MDTKTLNVPSVHLWSRESQHARPPCASQTPGVYSNSCPLSWWCHPAISFYVVPLSSCPQSLPASEYFPMHQLFTWGGQSIGVSASASVLPMNTQNWSPLGRIGWISLHLRGYLMVLPGGSDSKKSGCNAGDPGLIPGSGRCSGGWLPTPVFLPGEFHVQRSLAGYSPWGHKELDTT